MKLKPVFIKISEQFCDVGVGNFLFAYKNRCLISLLYIIIIQIVCLAV